MKKIITLAAAALMAVAGTSAFADQDVLRFPAPEKVQVSEVLNMGGSGPVLVMNLADFCEINVEQIKTLATNCSMEAWIDKGDIITIRL